MNSLKANVYNETEKILMRKKYLVFIVLAALLPLTIAFLLIFFQSKFALFNISSDGFSVFILGLFSNLILPVFVFSVVSDIFPGEFNDKTIKLTLTRPISRFKVFLSKNLALAIYALLILIVVFITSSISALFIHGTFQFNLFFESIIAYVAALIPTILIGVIAVFLAQFFKNSSGAMITSLFVFIAGKVIPYLFPTAGKVLPFYYTDWHVLWLGNNVGFSTLLNAFLIQLSYIVIFFTIGFLLFERKDV